MLADTVEVMLPSVFDDAEPPAFQFHDAIPLPLLFAPSPLPTVNPSLLKDVKEPVAFTYSASDLSGYNVLVAPLTESNASCVFVVFLFFNQTQSG